MWDTIVGYVSEDLIYQGLHSFGISNVRIELVGITLSLGVGVRIE